MIINKDLKISINPANRVKYEKILGVKLKNKEIISINQNLILHTSRTEVECNCDICSKTFKRKRVNIKTGTTLCGNSCRNEWLKRNNPNPVKDKVFVKCSNCDNHFEVSESKFKGQKHFLCSRECYVEHRKNIYHGDKIYNYQDEKVKCSTCGNNFKTSKWYTENKIHQFCSQQCYWIHRKDYYEEFYYKTDLNDSRKETVTERSVREWLESNGLIKNKDFFQEKELFRRYFADFYIEERNMVLEVYGDYWHVNPEVYDVYNNNSSKKPMNGYQSKRVDSNKDELRRLDIESYGYDFQIIWEKEINDDIDKFLSLIFKR